MYGQMCEINDWMVQLMCELKKRTNEHINALVYAWIGYLLDRWMHTLMTFNSERMTRLTVLVDALVNQYMHRMQDLLDAGMNAWTTAAFAG